MKDKNIEVEVEEKGKMEQHEEEGKMYTARRRRMGRSNRRTKGRRRRRKGGQRRRRKISVGF